MSKKEFAKAAIDKNDEAFVVHIVFLSIIHPARKAQTIFLFTEEIKIADNYLDYADVFSKKKLR